MMRHCVMTFVISQMAYLVYGYLALQTEEESDYNFFVDKSTLAESHLL